MYSQNNINHILDIQHSKDRLISFPDTYVLLVRLEFFNHLPPESTLEMLSIMRASFNKDIMVFSSAVKKEVTGYTEYLNRRYGLVQGTDMVSLNCANLVFNSVFKACLVETSPWISLMINDSGNFAAFIPPDKYNRIDYLYQLYQMLGDTTNINIQTEGVKNGLIILI
jgi:hypothetical protein